MVAMLRPRRATLTPAGPARLATTASTRTRGSTWQAICARVIDRDGGLCRACAKFGHVTPAQEVDHARPLWAGGSDQLGNLQALCGAHHRAKTAAEEATRRAGAAWQPWHPAPVER